MLNSFLLHNLYIVERESYRTKADGDEAASGTFGSSKSKLLARAGGLDSGKLVV
jgi:hypothetical protein